MPAVFRKSRLKEEYLSRSEHDFCRRNRVTKKVSRGGKQVVASCKMVSCPHLSATLCSIANLLINSMNYQTPQDLNSPQQLTDGDVYDFIVVGGGSAGSVVANRLSEQRNWKVLLLEAGGEEPDIADVPAFTGYTGASRLNWNYTTEPDCRFFAGRSNLWISGRGLGGSSLHNNIVYNRGNRLSYDQWEKLGNTGWGYEDLLPYFKKWENQENTSLARDTRYHSTGGPQSVGNYQEDRNARILFNAFEELGYPQTDINARNQTGACMVQYFQNNGFRQSANKAFLAPVRKRPNLKIVTNVRAIKIVIDPDTKEAKGVEYRWENDRCIGGTVYARKEVIVSAGSIASPQLLMLSGIGPEETLKSLDIDVIADLKVGYNFQNHMMSGSLYLALSEPQNPLPSDDQAVQYLLQYYSNRTGPFAKEGTFDVTLYFSSRYTNATFPDLQFHFYPSTAYTSNNVTTQYPPLMSNYNRIAAVVLLDRPKSKGQVTINTTDPFAYPLIFPNYFSDIQDVNAMIDGYNWVLDRLSKTDTLKQHGITVDTTPTEQCKDLPYASDEYWKCDLKYNLRTSHHFSGSCRMGPSSDSNAVVDPELKVHNVKRLRVADTSVQPEIINSNTHSIALTIGEKASDLIKKTWAN